MKPKPGTFEHLHRQWSLHNKLFDKIIGWKKNGKMTIMCRDLPEGEWYHYTNIVHHGDAGYSYDTMCFKPIVPAFEKIV